MCDICTDPVFLTLCALIGLCLGWLAGALFKR